MKYKTLYQTARQIDHTIDHYLHKTGSATIPQLQLRQLIQKNFPEYYVKDYGWHKIVFGIKTTQEKIVLKVGNKRSIENDHRAYKRLPESLRHQFFAKIYWHTKYCLLQEYGYPASVSPEELDCLRLMLYKYGIFDVKAENIKQIGGQLKIVDANATSYPVATLLRKMDEVKPKLPKQLVLVLKKATRALYEK